jgi:hypothetical protein
MTLQSLTATVAAMTPGPYFHDDENDLILTGHLPAGRNAALPPAVCRLSGPRSATEVNADGIVALRNHADALIACAALLREYYDEIGVPEHLADLDKRIIAALARLEEIK